MFSDEQGTSIRVFRSSSTKVLTGVERIFSSLSHVILQLLTVWGETGHLWQCILLGPDLGTGWRHRRSEMPQQMLQQQFRL
ncbi:hypothetical protein ASF69_16380 [Rhizobium sp. Leaf311]|nr:hypothetical protein ASF69_16380 [Rhizobium sp. Leaf311]